MALAQEEMAAYFSETAAERTTPWGISLHKDHPLRRMTALYVNWAAHGEHRCTLPLVWWEFHCLAFLRLDPASDDRPAILASRFTRTAVGPLAGEIVAWCIEAGFPMVEYTSPAAFERAAAHFIRTKAGAIGDNLNLTVDMLVETQARPPSSTR